MEPHCRRSREGHLHLCYAVLSCERSVLEDASTRQSFPCHTSLFAFEKKELLCLAFPKGSFPFVYHVYQWTLDQVMVTGFFDISRFLFLCSLDHARNCKLVVWNTDLWSTVGYSRLFLRSLFPNHCRRWLEQQGFVFSFSRSRDEKCFFRIFWSRYRATLFKKMWSKLRGSLKCLGCTVQPAV